MAVDKIKAHFIVEKVTPGAVRFKETTEDGTPYEIKDGAKIGTIYVRKSALDGDVPKKITVEITIG